MCFIVGQPLLAWPLASVTEARGEEAALLQGPRQEPAGARTGLLLLATEPNGSWLTPSTLSWFTPPPPALQHLCS